MSALRLASLLRCCASLICGALLPAAVAASTPAEVPPEGEASSVPAAVAVTQPAPATKSLLVLELSANNIDEETVRTISSFVTVEVSKHAYLQVMGGAEVERMLALHADQQMADCDDTGCAVELAGALGAELVLTGQVGRLDRRLLVTLALIDAHRAQSISRVTVSSDDLDELPDALAPAIAELVAPVRTELIAAGHSVGEGDGAEHSERAVWPWVVAGSGVALLVAGTGATVVGLLRRQEFVDGRAALGARQDSQSGVPSGDSLVEIAQQWEATEAARADWNSWGVVVAGVGAPLAVIGLGAAAVGVVLGLWPAQSSGEGT